MPSPDAAFGVVAFVGDGSFSAATSALDVDGDDPTRPLTPIRAGGSVTPPVDVDAGVPLDAGGGELDAGVTGDPCAITDQTLTMTPDPLIPVSPPDRASLCPPAFGGGCAVLQAGTCTPELLRFSREGASYTLRVAGSVVTSSAGTITSPTITDLPADTDITVEWDDADGIRQTVVFRFTGAVVSFDPA